MIPARSKQVKSRLISRALLSLKTRMSWGTRLLVTSAPPTKPSHSAEDKIGDYLLLGLFCLIVTLNDKRCPL